MNDDQITVLAREYAEWICPYKDKSANLSILDIREAERLINFLLRRFCLVEKDVVKNFYQSRKDFLAHKNEYDRDIVNDISIEVKLLSCMFPEIAKEVEG